MQNVDCAVERIEYELNVFFNWRLANLRRVRNKVRCVCVECSLLTAVEI